MEIDPEASSLSGNRSANVQTIEDEQRIISLLAWDKGRLEDEVVEIDSTSHHHYGTK